MTKYNPESLGIYYHHKLSYPTTLTYSNIVSIEILLSLNIRLLALY